VIASEFSIGFFNVLTDEQGAIKVGWEKIRANTRRVDGLFCLFVESIHKTKILIFLLIHFEKKNPSKSKKKLPAIPR